MVRIIGTATLFLLFATTAPAPVWAQKGEPNEGQGKPDKQAKEDKDKPGKQDKDKPHPNAGKPQPKTQVQRAAPPARGQAHQQQLVRLSQQRQQQLITEQQRRVTDYRQRLDQQQRAAEQYAAQLQQQKRLANYRFQQDYLARMRQQRLALQSPYDYNNDPYFYTSSSYRYSRGGNFYETNEYGAKMLRQAVNTGYAEGYRAGQADRQDRWASDYRSSYAYQDANYGYNGYYVNQADYNYYFREGFSRGYQDGYSSRAQYGQYSNGSGNILSSILAQILNLQSMR